LAVRAEAPQEPGGPKKEEPNEGKKQERPRTGSLFRASSQRGQSYSSAPYRKTYMRVSNWALLQ